METTAYTFNGSFRELAMQWLEENAYATSADNIALFEKALDNEKWVPTSVFMGTQIRIPNDFAIEGLQEEAVKSDTSTNTSGNNTASFNSLDSSKEASKSNA